MKLSELLNEEPEQILYHVTQTKNVPSISDVGIIPKKKPSFHGAFGQDIRQKKDAIYAFEKLVDAIGMCFRWKWEMKGIDLSIIVFKADMSDWEEDTHWEAKTGHGKWLVSTKPVNPETIIGVTKYDDSMIEILKKEQAKRMQ